MFGFRNVKTIKIIHFFTGRKAMPTSVVSLICFIQLNERGGELMLHLSFSHFDRPVVCNVSRKCSFKAEHFTGQHASLLAFRNFPPTRRNFEIF
jgi:hypothetical protein